MAATIAEATGCDRTRSKNVHRLGSVAAHVKAATWRTFVVAAVNADGSGSLIVKRDGDTIHSYTFGPES